jgi:hypothetical protein
VGNATSSENQNLYFELYKDYEKPLTEGFREASFDVIPYSL